MGLKTNHTMTTKYHEESCHARMLEALIRHGPMTLFQLSLASGVRERDVDDLAKTCPDIQLVKGRYQLKP